MIPDGWQKTINRLKREIPPPLPVTVRTVKKLKTNEFGYTESDGDRFKVVIERGCPNCMLWTLLHEWLHTLDHWHLNQQDHPDTASVYYMRVYRIVFDVD